MFTELPNPPSEFSAKTYDEEIKITKPNSDLDIHELLDVFHRLTIGCGFSDETWKSGIMEMAAEYEEEIREDNP